MTPLTLEYRLRSPGAGACGALVVVQSLILAYLLHFNVTGAAWLVLLVGVPAALVCYRLLAHAGDERWRYLPVAMFAAGGVGMLLGFALDAGPLGLAGLLALCRAWSSQAFWPSLGQLWIDLGLMRWAIAGMLIMGNAGMATFDILHRARGSSPVRLLGVYGLCNTGMLLGMALAGHWAMRFTAGLDYVTAGVLMITTMLGGMTAGMSVMLMLMAGIIRIERAFH